MDQFKRILPNKGTKSTRYPHLGVWVFSLGPNSPVPGDRLRLAIINQRGDVERRMEQVLGNCQDEGYVDYFMGSNCRPALYAHPIVDMTPDGKVQEILCHDYCQTMGMKLYLDILDRWTKKWGKQEYSF